MVILLRGFWIVCVLLSICGGSIFTWTIGSICMTIPFMMTSCYEKQTSSSVVVLKTSQHVQMQKQMQPMQIMQLHAAISRSRGECRHAL